MVERFEVGKYYKIKDEITEKTSSTFRCASMNESKRIMFDHKPRKCLGSDCGVWLVFEGIPNGSWHWNKNDFDEVRHTEDVVMETTEDKKMELKDIKNKNLKEAKKQYDTEKANEEIRYAKERMAKYMDRIDECDREIKKQQVLKLAFEDILAPFKNK